MPPYRYAADAAEVKQGATVVVVGDGAVGLMGVLAAQQMGAERIITMSRHATRQTLAREFGATDIVAERGPEGIARILDMTKGIGADSVLECVGTMESMEQALAVSRPGGSIGYVGVPHGVKFDGQQLFFGQKRMLGGPAPVRRFLPDLMDRVLKGTIQPGKVFDLTLPLWDELDEAIRLTKKEWDSLVAAATKKQKEAARNESAGRPSEFGVTKKDATGKLDLDKKGRYSAKDGWIYDDAVGEKGAFICQEFFHDGFGMDERGDNATHTILWAAATEGGAPAEKRFSFRRGELADGGAIIRRLGDANFQYDLGRKDYVRTLLNSLNFPPDTLLVPTSGWYERAFVFPDGTFLAPAEDPGRKLQLLNSTSLVPYRSATGSLKGWQDAVAPVFENNALGVEHWALGIMAGAGGTILNYFMPAGRYVFSLIARSSIGKTIALLLMVSVQGPANAQGLFFDCDMTSNAPEAISHERSGLSIALDEANKADDPKTLKKVTWAESGTGKNRMERVNDKFQLAENKTFVGLLGITSEFTIKSILENAGIVVPTGFDARICEIQCENVTIFKEDAFIKNVVDGAKRNSGHALLPVIRKLQGMSSDEVRERWNVCRSELIREDMSPFEKRGLNSIATIYLSGLMMQETGVIPAEFDVKRIVEWAIDNRAGGKLPDEKEKAYAAIRSAFAKLNGSGRVREMTANEPVPTIEGNGPTAYTHGARGKEPVVIFHEDVFAKLVGNVGLGTIRNHLKADGYWIMNGKNNYFDTMPAGPHAKNCRLKLSFFEGVTEVAEDAGKAKRDPTKLLMG